MLSVKTGSRLAVILHDVDDLSFVVIRIWIGRQQYPLDCSPKTLPWPSITTWRLQWYNSCRRCWIILSRANDSEGDGVRRDLIRRSSVGGPVLPVNMPLPPTLLSILCFQLIPMSAGKITAVHFPISQYHPSTAQTGLRGSSVERLGRWHPRELASGFQRVLGP
ncbi:hypothetical protein NEOLEDRAFT_316136 [Neolentinus lepideus HHB14362 ss-1]|uniref:Uncharacterized protein n=1 Tax=Neolentinus lepideus HHB14362 ss-1 TaxID=1314782 RepID=A0A165VU95_9AGAM|nr:hypothetical protein NEOLEDRAFT_316136 [Neolentinus lepideus HHB14362 ss-1]